MFLYCAYVLFLCLCATLFLYCVYVMTSWEALQPDGSFNLLNYMALNVVQVFRLRVRDLKICSLNVKGLGDGQKRREIFNWLRLKALSIHFLQEVHCSDNVTSIWSAEWGYKTLFSSFSSAKRGVAILFNNSFAFKFQKPYADPNGRFIICDIETEEKYITLANVYAPNDDEPIFFHDFFDHLLDFQYEELIIGGDFNLVLELEKDKRGGLTQSRSKYCTILLRS